MNIKSDLSLRKVPEEVGKKLFKIKLTVEQMIQLEDFSSPFSNEKNEENDNGYKKGKGSEAD